MRCGRWAGVAKFCRYALGVVTPFLLFPVYLGAFTTLTLVLAVALSPFTLGWALKLTAFIACSLLSLALGDRRERTELLVCAIGGLQPPDAGEKYGEAMLAEIRAAESHRVRAIGFNLMITAPRTILAEWISLLRPARSPGS